MKVCVSSNPSFNSTKMCCQSQAARWLNLLGLEDLKIGGGKMSHRDDLLKETFHV